MKWNLDELHKFYSCPTKASVYTLSKKATCDFFWTAGDMGGHAKRLHPSLSLQDAPRGLCNTGYEKFLMYSFVFVFENFSFVSFIGKQISK